MPIPTVSNGMILAIRIYTYDLDQVGINELDYRCSASAGTGANLGQISLNEEARWAPLYKAILPSSVQFYGLGVRILSPNGNKSLEYTSSILRGNGTAGTANGEPKQAAPLITKKSDTPGPRGRGRIFLPFPPSGSSVGNGQVSGAYTASMVNIASAMLTVTTFGSGGNTSSLTPVVYSRKNGLTFDITSAIPSPRFATIKKRGDYGRKNSVPFA